MFAPNSNQPIAGRISKKPGLRTSPRSEICSFRDPIVTIIPHRNWTRAVFEIFYARKDLICQIPVLFFGLVQEPRRKNKASGGVKKCSTPVATLSRMQNPSTLFFPHNQLGIGGWGFRPHLKLSHNRMDLKRIQIPDFGTKVPLFMGQFDLGAKIPPPNRQLATGGQR